MLTTSYVSQQSPPKQGKLHSRSSIAQYGQTTRLSNPDYDLTPIARDVKEWKPWNTFYWNANTIQNRYGTN
jgi:hypothetical protein